MIKLIKRYFLILLLHQKLWLGKDLSLPVNSFLMTIGSGVYFVLHLVSFRLIISKFSFTGWETSQLWVLFFSFEAFTYSVFYLFWRGLTHTVRDVSSGKMDFLISKPISSRFISLVRGGGLHNVVAILLGFYFVIKTIADSHLSISIFSVVFYLLGFAISLWMTYCIASMFLSLNFFFGRIDGSSGAIFTFQENMKYPSTIYAAVSPLLKFLVIPMSLLVYVPVSLLLGKYDLSLLVGYLVFFVVLTVGSYVNWQKAIRSYSSASS